MGGGYWAAQPLPDGDGNDSVLLIGEGVATVLSADTLCRMRAASRR